MTLNSTLDILKDKIKTEEDRKLAIKTISQMKIVPPGCFTFDEILQKPGCYQPVDFGVHSCLLIISPIKEGSLFVNHGSVFPLFLDCWKKYYFKKAVPKVIDE